MNITLQDWARASKATIALVFTDIVDSTTLGNQLGDEQWTEVLLKHFAQARTLLSNYDCYEIKIIGDSLMVAFRTVIDALDFALSFHNNTGDERIEIRAGIHVGPVRIIDNDVFGMMVNYTKRVESQAEYAAVILSNEAKTHIAYEKAVRHSGLKFDLREVTLKGFTEPQKLWIVFDAEAFKAALSKKVSVGSMAKKIFFG
jgi:class 3 adenylate cyclase